MSITILFIISGILGFSLLVAMFNKFLPFKVLCSKLGWHKNPDKDSECTRCKKKVEMDSQNNFY